MILPSLAIRLDYGGDALCNREAAVDRVAEIVSRPIIANVLTRISCLRSDRNLAYTRTSRESIRSALTDPTNEAASFDSGRNGELIASAQIQSGTMVRPGGPPATRFMAYFVLPYVATQLEAILQVVVELASALEAAAGFIAIEASYSSAHEVALGGRRPRGRLGLSEQRRRERRARDWHDDRIDAQLSGIEWGTLLGPGHLAAVTATGLALAALRDTFDRVIDIGSSRALALATAWPVDDLDERGFEERLAAIRATLAPIVMDVGALPL